jgi:hypothetical protein
LGVLGEYDERQNVATSRARVLLCAGGESAIVCRSVRQVRLANGVCGYHQIPMPTNLGMTSIVHKVGKDGSCTEVNVTANCPDAVEREEWILKWRTVGAQELLEAATDEDIGQIVPSLPGVYVWRRSFEVPSHCVGSSNQFKKWIDDIAKNPAARLTRSPISFCMWSEGFQVGGGGLTEDKTRTLDSLSQNRQGRELLASFVESLSSFSPAIYVGQTDNLRRRARSHVHGRTNLSEYVDGLGLSLGDLTFSYVVLGKSEESSDAATEARELMELLAQRTLAPFGTNRPG